MIQSNLRSWKPGKGYEINYAHGVDLSSKFDILVNSPSPFWKIFHSTFAGEYSDIISDGCELYLMKEYNFNDDDIRKCYQLGVGFVVGEKFGELCQCGCQNVHNDPIISRRMTPERLEARRRRGRELRKREERVKKSRLLVQT